MAWRRSTHLDERLHATLPLLMPAGASLAWYWNRLRQMSAIEVVLRLASFARVQAERVGVGTAALPPPAAVDGTPFAWIGPPGGVDLGRYVAAADEILAGRLPILGLGVVEYGHPPQWNRDPQLGVVAPLQFGSTLDYRNVALVGNIKYLWEPNRHLHLVTLAQAFALDGNPRFLQGIRIQLESWFDQCRYLKGPNWASSLELGTRLINWAIVWQLVGGSSSPLFQGTEAGALRQRWLKSIYQHQHFIANHFSVCSSANNHLIGEAAGLFVATVTWPYWPKSARWRQQSKGKLVTEMSRQNAPDGVNREQAIGYIPFVVEFFIIAALAGRAVNEEFPKEYWRRIEAVLEFLASIMDVGGQVPMFGDSDDGVVSGLGLPTNKDPFRSLLATGAVLFGRADLAGKAGGLDEKTRWLTAGIDAKRLENAKRECSRLPVRQCFRDGGYYVLGSGFESPEEIRIVADIGPLGYGRLAAHGHADALSFTLSLGGHEFLIDPGTYDYFSNASLRRYLRSTAAHNTLVVDGEDQSIMGGTFMWLSKAKVVAEVVDVGQDVQRVVGRHEGYLRLSDSVVHRRVLEFKATGRVLRIRDELECRDRHTIAAHWHFDEACRVEVCGSKVTASRGDWTLLMHSTPAADEAQVLIGQEDPPLGWRSPKFGVLVPSPTVRLQWSLGGAGTIDTVFSFERRIDR